MKPRRTRRAVVVDIVNGDLGHAELVEYALATGAIAVAVASDALIDIVVVDLGVKKGFDARFETELGVVDLASRLDELGQTYTQHIGRFERFLAHGEYSAHSVGIATRRRRNIAVKDMM